MVRQNRRILTKLHVCVSEAASSAGAPVVVVVVTALEDDLFHNELRLRHIGSRRHDDEELEELFDAAATDGNRADSVKRSECRVLLHVIRQSSLSAATHGILLA